MQVKSLIVQRGSWAARWACLCPVQALLAGAQADIGPTAVRYLKALGVLPPELGSLVL